MRAVVRYQGLPPADPRSLVDAEVETPVARGCDVLVRVEALSVSSVDARSRALHGPTPQGRILGGEGAGTVAGVGPDVTRFRVGDDVWWVGDVDRPGSNADFQLVDERDVGLKPATLSWAEAAAMPLTAITAWEALFDRLHLGPTSTETVLVVGASGEVGSILLQLARARLPHVRTVATVSSDREAAWVHALGARAVVDSRRGIVEQVHAAAPDGVDWIFTASAHGLGDVTSTVFRPFGNGLFRRDGRAADAGTTARGAGGGGGGGIASHWDVVFTRPLERVPTAVGRRAILDDVARLVDAGGLRTTLATRFVGLDARTLRRAHAVVEAGPAIGKVVVAR